MPETRIVTIYIDYKSPYAYLAKDPAYALARDFGAQLDWLPYILDIPSFLGSATLDEQGRVIEESRNAHQWRRVKYSYMDCRREAKKRGLTIRGPQKIWNSTLAACGLLYAKRQGDDILRRYNDITFERFWKRELDIENPAVVAGVLAEAGADTAAFAAYAAEEGPREVDQVSRAAEDAGIFGTPSFVIDGELFWGNEHLPTIREILAGNIEEKAR
ncbi:MAG TPA: DsbA family protein [Stellaceae bacterium]|nr:DsbA family protein [Stellaceae bacterium]